MSPCCKFRHQNYYDKPLNIKEATIDQYLESSTLKLVKQDFLNNKWPSGCERCKLEEENNIKSKRELDYERWAEHYGDYDESDGFITASIAFGNTCNLACVTCGPEASSKWYQEWLKLYNQDVRPNHFYKEDFVQNFLNNAPNIIHLDIPGGEPLLSGVKQQKELLNHYISNGISKKITLHYTTNATLFPDNEWLNLWGHFKNVDIQLSIDDIEQRFEYIRFHANWNDVLANIQRYIQLRQNSQNLSLNVSTTVSAYNIAYLDELTHFLYKIGLGSPYYGRVHFPKFMRPTIWRQDAKDYIIAKLAQSQYDFSNYINLLRNENDDIHFQDFRYRLLRQDNYRKTSFGKTFPEMLQFLKN